ncbi:MAG: hypothetical protein Rubg2KO_00960 [Rubricoccaceae bacterium]
MTRTLFFAALALGLMAAPVEAQRIAPGGKRAEARVQSGVASYYARSLHGNRTANGERYNHGAMTVAHKSLPFGTLLRVRSQHSGRAVLVRVNDRGPFIRGRVLDLSGAAADRLRMRQRGTARVSYEIVDPATLPSRQAPPPRKVRHI